MSFKILISKKVYKDFQTIPVKMAVLIKEAVYFLADHPFPVNSKRLKGFEYLYRIRAGQYRIVYEVKKTIKLISVIKVAHRKNVYKFLKN